VLVEPRLKLRDLVRGIARLKHNIFTTAHAELTRAQDATVALRVCDQHGVRQLLDTKAVECGA
jgi:hypothetical protein